MPIGKLPAKFAKPGEFKLKSAGPSEIFKSKSKKKLKWGK
jgi:hypothetical protein